MTSQRADTPYVFDAPLPERKGHEWAWLGVGNKKEADLSEFLTERPGSFGTCASPIHCVCTTQTAICSTLRGPETSHGVDATL